MPQSRCKDTEAQKQIDRFVIKKSVVNFSPRFVLLCQRLITRSTRWCGSAPSPDPS